MPITELWSIHQRKFFFLTSGDPVKILTLREGNSCQLEFVESEAAHTITHKLERREPTSKAHLQTPPNEDEQPGSKGLSLHPLTSRAWS